ncbi:MAG: hypothetical protein EPN64_04510 [Burkholderiaceae bacterium]|nr:MAG: hypothetical protein EPN64_04510 [Burkholderiaceae bacterium]
MRIAEGLLDILIAFAYVFLTVGVLVGFASKTAQWVKMDLTERGSKDISLGLDQQPASVAGLEVGRGDPERE